jgi:murein DD-endopeptidase MepM/ murein hydrolase activator NlpD
MNHFPQSEFVSYLIRINKLDALDFDRFVFFYGMLFGSKKKWWGKKGLRSSAHEGLDLCFFQSRQDKNFRLDGSTEVPMIYDGQVVHMTDDFLGKTVITRHTFEDPEQHGLLSLYGHLNPDKNLRIGDEIKAGQAFAKIAGFANRKTILLPHVHISLAKPELLPPADRLEWEFLNTVDQNVFIDPLKVIPAEHAVREYDDQVDVSKLFARCSQFNGDG